MNRKIFLLACLFSLFSCNNAENYEEAHWVYNNNVLEIKLKGKRVLMSHSLKSLFSKNTYEDSFLIPVHSKADTIIDGSTIPVPTGSYKFKGNISINSNQLIVNLLIDNTDDKIVRPFGWNGKYQLNK